MTDNIYHYSALDIDGNPVNFSEFHGKYILIVNTASHCQFTPQYEGLEIIYRRLKDKDFVVLGFPCNQFGEQEPAPEERIKDFCKKNFGITFPLFHKIDVNGEDAHPLYKFLKHECPGILRSESIKWNFTKFLINRQGIPIRRYSPMSDPELIAIEIEEMMEEELVAA